MSTAARQPHAGHAGRTYEPVGGRCRGVGFGVGYVRHFFDDRQSGEAGDEIVSANNLYGGTFTLFNDILPQFGITTRFVKPQDFDKMEAAVNGRTRALYVEAIGNPALDVADLDAVSAIAKRHGLPWLWTRPSPRRICFGLLSMVLIL